LVLRAATVFLSAFLLFEVQPVIARTILPWFGGAPAVWTACMLFFQTLLLVGYALAHAAVRALPLRMQGALLLALAAGALVFLPIAPAAAASTAGTVAPVLAVLVVLARSVALPFLALAMSTPLQQSWAAREPGAASPYRLYALSNAGSLLALLAYPLVVEPWLTTREQATGWSAAFVAFVLMSALGVVRIFRGVRRGELPIESAAAGATPEVLPTPRQRWLWLALPACASTLLLAVTNQLCQEVAVVPLLWIVPLALYLLSFVLCFESDRWYSRSWCVPALLLTLIVLAQSSALGAHAGVLYALPVESLGLFVCCMFCHGELAARRPAARFLTSYYLRVALGGALGAVFVSLLAPLLFRGFDEIYVGLAACGAFAAAFLYRSLPRASPGQRLRNPTLLALLGVVALIATMLGLRVLTRTQPALRELRSFFGVLRVQDLLAPDGSGRMRYLTHGGTRHGQQYGDPELRSAPTTYYGRTSGVGRLLDDPDRKTPLRIGVVGLGAGVLAAYGREGDLFRFYEINPQMIDVAQREFSFLRDSRARIEIAAGDARLLLEGEEGARFDVLVLDAFSSDAIPVHLLTAEAFDLYERRLAPGGVLALHVTTRHLDLGPLIAALVRRSGQLAFEIRSEADDARALLDARWILVTSNREVFERPKIRDAGRPLAVSPASFRVWTDDYSNLLQVLGN
jgi:SAM-dependent methyltransferase